MFIAVALFGTAAGAAPQARLKSEVQLDPVYNQGIARAKEGENIGSS